MWPKAIIFLKERHFFYHDLNRSCILEHWLEVKLLSCVSLFATQWTVAHHAPLSIGFSRQEGWRVLPFLSPGDLPDPGVKAGSLLLGSLLFEPPGNSY